MARLLLLLRGHGGLRLVALGRGSGLWRLLLAGSAFRLVVGGREFFCRQAKRRAKGGGAADRGQPYKRRGPLNAIRGEMLLVLLLLLLLLVMLDLKMVTLVVIARRRQWLEIWIMGVCCHGN